MANLERANNDPELQAIILAHCANNPVDWINDWVWTFDPRKKPANLPFLLFPRQAEFILWLEELYQGKEDGVADKCRDVGFTWLCVAWQVHHWLFEDGFKGTFGSRKEKLVDELGNPDCIFEKARFILRMLPQWMMPKGFNWKQHDNFMRLSNPANGSAITGEAGDNMGRGGRSSIYMADEFAFVERAQKVDAAISQNSDCKIYVSTPNGQGNVFYTKRFSGAYKTFTFRWQDDPRKTPEWYEEQKRKLDPIVFAQEIDIDYTASVQGIVIPQTWVVDARSRQAPKQNRAGWQIGVDVGGYGSDPSAIVVRKGPVIPAKHLAAWTAADVPGGRGEQHIVDYTVGRVAAKAKELRSLKEGEPTIHVDGIGIGAGVVAGLMAQGFRVIDVQAGESAPNPLPEEPECAQKRDWLWWKARLLFAEDKPVIEGVGVDNRKLVEQLTTELSTPTYSYTNSGKIKVESKKDMKKRGVASPNLADALIHTFEFDTRAPKEEAESPFKRRRDRKDSGSPWTR